MHGMGRTHQRRFQPERELRKNLVMAPKTRGTTTQTDSPRKKALTATLRSSGKQWYMPELVDLRSILGHVIERALKEFRLFFGGVLALLVHPPQRRLLDNTELVEI